MRKPSSPKFRSLLIAGTMMACALPANAWAQANPFEKPATTATTNPFAPPSTPSAAPAKPVAVPVPSAPVKAPTATNPFAAPAKPNAEQVPRYRPRRSLPRLLRPTRPRCPLHSLQQRLRARSRRIGAAGRTAPRRTSRSPAVRP